MHGEDDQPGLLAQRRSRHAQGFGRAGRTAVFISLDGPLVEGGCDSVDPALLKFALGAVECLAALDAAGHALILFAAHSSRPGGRLSRAQTTRLQRELQRRLLAEAGVEVLDFAACPHPLTADETPTCPCRPPAPGLLLRAAREHGLDLSRSWAVVGTLDEVQAGQRAGCHTVLLDHGNDGVRRRHTPPLRQPLARCTAWDEVVHLILLESRRTTAHGRRFGMKI